MAIQGGSDIRDGLGVNTFESRDAGQGSGGANGGIRTKIEFSLDTDSDEEARGWPHGDHGNEEQEAVDRV